jgi:hypothetical protein
MCRQLAPTDRLVSPAQQTAEQAWSRILAIRNWFFLYWKKSKSPAYPHGYVKGKEQHWSGNFFHFFVLSSVLCSKRSAFYDQLIEKAGEE